MKSLVSLSGTALAGFSEDVMGDMAVYFKDGTQYEPSFIDDLRKCNAKWDDPNLNDAMDSTW